MKLRLDSVYTQSYDGTWSAEIVDHPHIRVDKAEDLETAKVFLRIIAAEEIDYINKYLNTDKYKKARRKEWDIVTETIHYFRPQTGVEHE